MKICQSSSGNTIQGWKYYKHAAIPSTAPHVEPDLNPVKDGRIWSLNPRDGMVLFVRYIFGFDCQKDTPFWFVIKDNYNGIQEIPSKYRSSVRKALDAFEIKILSKEYLLNNGYEVYKKAAENYKVKTYVQTLEQFGTTIKRQDSSYSYWGCIHKESGKLAAYAINCIIDGIVEYQTMKFHPDFLSQYHPSYGLIFEMNRYYLEEKKMLFVSDGSRSITDHSGIQPFLIQKFKFRKAHCNLQVVYRPWFGVVVKLLFPFRRLIKNRNIAAILRQEAWTRGIDE